MGEQIDDLVLLAILQNQIKNAVNENKVDISNLASVKHVNAPFGLTQEDKDDTTKLRFDKEVITDSNGDVTYTDASTETYTFPKPQNFILKADKYPHVVFYANYFNDSTDSIIYRFSSGIILDSSTETPQYKIVFASYNVKTAKVTFVERVLT